MKDNIIAECPACKGCGTRHIRSGGALILVACDKCRGNAQVSKTIKQHMTSDLIYCGREQYQECVNELKAEYPGATITDASDNIHGGRFQIEVPGLDQQDFRLFILRKGYLDISLDLGLLKNTEPKEFMDLVKQVIGESSESIQGVNPHERQHHLASNHNT